VQDYAQNMTVGMLCASQPAIMAWWKFQKNDASLHRSCKIRPHILCTVQYVTAYHDAA